MQLWEKEPEVAPGWRTGHPITSDSAFIWSATFTLEQIFISLVFVFCEVDCSLEVGGGGLFVSGKRKKQRVESLVTACSRQWLN